MREEDKRAVPVEEGGRDGTSKAKSGGMGERET